MRKALLWGLLATAAPLAFGQNPSLPPPPAHPFQPVPHTPDGKPDLSGVWQIPHTVTDISDGQPLPYTLAGKAAFDAARDVIDPLSYCALPGTPRAFNAGYPFKIIQTAKEVTILYEEQHMFRVIPIGASHPEDPNPSWLGDSVASWHGDTLVVDVTALVADSKTWLDGKKHPHSDALHVIERFTRTDFDHLRYEVIIDDPKFYTRSWAAAPRVFNFRPDWRLIEYVCEENNRDIPHLRPH
jgi:hypothetical protein